MAKRRKNHSASPTAAKANAPVAAASTPATRPSTGKLWLFRLLAAVGIPLLFFALLELVLRLSGAGYLTGFLLPASHNGRNVFVQNNQFGWRFFGPRMARLPDAISIPQKKSSDTVRIFVFGESAAKGEPQPAFGPARMLQAMLSLRHPGARFEVVNAAMTAINSHTVLPIARDCAKADGDIWVIYMGNNEVVGPFGAGTVFGQQTPPLPMIRTTLALKTTRTGQMLDLLLAGLRRQEADTSEWHGMKMFLDQQVRVDDPRMNTVYHHFEHNLKDIIQTGQRSGVGIVVSTVAVNLRDCAPLASMHRTNFPDTDKTRWDNLLQLGIKAYDTGDHQEAARRFEEAARVDNTYAELRFRQGLCALALGQANEAREHFLAARDLDTLRFRCDSRLNGLTRQVVTNRESERILLADVENAFAAQSPDGLPGSDLFYEHVHPTFKGNYLLAKTLAEKVEKLLPERIGAPVTASQPWPSEADCARRLAWTDWPKYGALQEILARVKSPPFTAQLNHDAQLQALTTLLEELSPALQPAGLAKAREAYETALVTSPDDAVLYDQLAALKQMAGDFTGAAISVRRELDLLPSNSQSWLRLGLILSRQQKFGDASVAFQRAIELDPMDVFHMQNLAQALWLLGRHDEAIAQYRRAVKIQPNFALAWVNLGQVLEESGRKAEAGECYQKALACQTRRAPDLVALARFCRNRNWNEAAATNYIEAIDMNPSDGMLRFEVGQFLITLGKFADATTHLAEAVRLSPDFAPAHQLYGTLLGQQGNPVEAEAQFREALRLAPNLLEARLNLGISVMTQGRMEEALAHFEVVLQRSPTNELALKYVRQLRSGR